MYYNLTIDGQMITAESFWGLMLKCELYKLKRMFRRLKKKLSHKLGRRMK
jgi:hypothetical protein